LNVFSLTNGADTAGIGGRLASAFARHGGKSWALRSMVATVNYIGYPQDVPWNQAKLEAMYDAADVVHLHNILFAHENYDAGQGKPTVLMHHGLKSGSGQPFPEMVRRAEAIGAVSVGSTLDLSIYEPSVHWLPAPYELESLRAIRQRAPEHDGIRIVHAPTNREIKGTEALIDGVAAMRVRGLPVELVMVERRSWADALDVYASADIAFDQPYLGYGCFAIECWAMGIPVVAGVRDPIVRAGMIAEWGELPFAEPSKLDVLVISQSARDEYAGRGLRHVVKYHDERVVVERAKAIYETARPTTPGGSAKRRSRPRHVALAPAWR
jgi:hypothetical protein